MEKENSRIQEDALPAGHPVSSLRKENEALLRLLSEIEGHDASSLSGDVHALLPIRALYAKKEEILLPLLRHHGVVLPFDEIWNEDNEIKEAMEGLAKKGFQDGLEEKRESLLSLSPRIRAIAKEDEETIFPVALAHLSQEEWYMTYRDLPIMGRAFLDSYPSWEEAEAWLQKQREKLSEHENDVVSLEGGSLTIKQLEAILKVLPLDVTYIDEKDENAYFSDKSHAFPRPYTALGRSVYECHPEKSREAVRKMIQAFKDGKADSGEHWLHHAPIRVLYLAVRDEKGNYLGMLEVLENFESALPMLRRYEQK